MLNDKAFLQALTDPHLLFLKKFATLNMLLNHLMVQVEL